MDRKPTPSAYLPVVMSAVAFTMALLHIALFGTSKQQDEGAAARVFQLLLIGQIPFILFYASKWIPVIGKEALKVIIIQLLAIIVAIITVFVLER